MPDDARGCQRVPNGARGCQMVPEGARGCQRGQIGKVVAPALGKASQLIFVKVSIAGVEVDALVDTGATMSCCRWGWYQQWKSRLGTLMKSSVRIIGVGHDPVKVKGLSKPLTLQWDGVGGQFQLMVLITLTDVDVVLGMEAHSQFDVKISFKNQVASPAREPCTPLGHREVHRIWICSHVKEDDNLSINISKQFFVKLAFILMLIGNVIKSALSLNSRNLKRVIELAALACVSRETRRSADLLLPTPPCSFGGKCSCAYILSHTNVYASGMHYFDKYINNLDSEYGTMSSYKLA